ncbi:hypothetical protein FVEN_g3164 [Fusarium venenatum]|nr:hypothetical protein FVEN_g3164 [Fusarium venenatum]
MATLKNLPRFLYEEVGSHCDNATLTSLISVCVNFYFLFSGFHLNHLYMAEISEKVVSFLHGLRYRSPRLLPHFKAIKTAKIHCEDWKWPEEDLRQYRNEFLTRTVTPNALRLIAPSNLTVAYLDCCDPLKLTSIDLIVSRLHRHYDSDNNTVFYHPDEYTWLSAHCGGQTGKLKRLRIGMGLDTSDTIKALKAPFLKVRTITKEFPNLALAGS